MSNAGTVAVQPSLIKRRSIWLYTLIAAGAAPALLWTVVDPIAGHSLNAVSGGGTMHVAMPWVVAGAVIPGGIGLATATLLSRLTNGRLVWLIVSGLVLLLSLGGPFGGTTTATVLVLMAMHLLVGAAVITGGYALAKR
ncbi:MAG: DUF6069 family protein [Stackebrandtia sp.]